MREESRTALEEMRAELERQHQTAVDQLQTVWSSETQRQIQDQVASAKAVWQEEQEQVGGPPRSSS